MIKLKKRVRQPVAQQRRRDLLAERQKADPFWWKAQGHPIPAVTVEWLVARWMLQNGRCAISGRPLSILFSVVDHTIPKARGGTDAAGNLRLLSKDANQMKNSMTDEELFALCREILVVQKRRSSKNGRPGYRGA